MVEIRKSLQEVRSIGMIPSQHNSLLKRLKGIFYVLASISLKISKRCHVPAGLITECNFYINKNFLDIKSR